MEPASYHAFALQMQAFPPDGYEIVRPPDQPSTKLYQIAARSHLGLGHLGWEMLRRAVLIAPVGLARAWLGRWNRLPSDAALTYSTDQLILRRQPWVLEVEYASLLLGAAGHLRRYKAVLEKVLSSRHCRAIRCWSEAGRRSLFDLDAAGFNHKIELIHYAVPPKRFTKARSPDSVRLFFVSSGTKTGDFTYRGGRETMEAFARLVGRYHNLELVVRSDVPSDVKSQYRGLQRLRIIEDTIPRVELEQEFRSADIFVFPSHNTSPMIILEAMGYELPIVTTDSWANPEYVEDGMTGLVIRRSARHRSKYFFCDSHQPNFESDEFVRAIRVPDPETVDGLANRIALLVENAELRRKLGRAARCEVEHGKFSLAVMNRQLKQMFDRAIADDGRVG